MDDIKNSVFAIILLIIGVGICSTILIFISVLGGGVYQTTSPQITSLSTVFTNETNSSTFVGVGQIYNTTNSNVFPGTEAITIFNSTALWTLTTNNYTVISYPNGQFNITDIGNKNARMLTLNITYTVGNPLIKGNITNAIINTFTAINYTGGYLPLIVLALVIFIILGLVFLILPKMSGGYMSLPSI